MQPKAAMSIPSGMCVQCARTRKLSPCPRHTGAAHDGRAAVWQCMCGLCTLVLFIVSLDIGPTVQDVRFLDPTAAMGAAAHSGLMMVEGPVLSCWYCLIHSSPTCPGLTATMPIFVDAARLLHQSKHQVRMIDSPTINSLQTMCVAARLRFGRATNLTVEGRPNHPIGTHKVSAKDMSPCSAWPPASHCQDKAQGVTALTHPTHISLGLPATQFIT
jgi:hypothetical protein